MKKTLLVQNPAVHWDVGVKDRCWSDLNKVWEEDRAVGQDWVTAQRHSTGEPVLLRYDLWVFLWEYQYISVLIDRCQCWTHRLLDEVDAGLQVQAEVDEAPLNALPLVLLLLQDEHGVVEQLLQLLVGVVDAHLLKRVQLEREREEEDIQ